VRPWLTDSGTNERGRTGDPFLKERTHSAASFGDWRTDGGINERGRTGDPFLKERVHSAAQFSEEEPGEVEEGESVHHRANAEKETAALRRSGKREPEEVGDTPPKQKEVVKAVESTPHMREEEFVDANAVAILTKKRLETRKPSPTASASVSRSRGMPRFQSMWISSGGVQTSSNAQQSSTEAANRTRAWPQSRAP